MPARLMPETTISAGLGPSAYVIWDSGYAAGSRTTLSLAAEPRAVTGAVEPLASVLNWTAQPRWEQLMAKMFRAGAAEPHS